MVKREGEARKHMEKNTFVCYIFIINSLTFQFKIYDYGKRFNSKSTIMEMKAGLALAAERKEGLAAD